MTLDIVDPKTGKLMLVDVATSSSSEQVVRLRAVEGTSRLQIRLREAGSLVFVGEVPLSAGEKIGVSFKANPVTVSCGERPVFRLNPALCEDPIILAPCETKAADIVFLIDGTSIHPSSTQAMRQPARLLGTPEWEHLTGSLAAAFSELERRFPDGVRSSVFAFGDSPIPSVSPAGYLLHPAESGRKLQRRGTEEILTALRRLPPCSGGDFVDALAEGLAACQQVGWWQNARKLVIVIGDSPGYSVVDGGQGVLDLADARCRTHDVNEEAISLHAGGVEIATVLLTKGLEHLEQTSETAEKLVAHTRRQYVELASVPAWALSGGNLEFGSFLASWADWKEPLARGPVPGILVD